MLSGSIEHRVELGPAVPRTERVDQLHKLVLERSHLFIHSSKNEKIHRDAKWLENNLGINQVQFIRKKMIFRPKSPYPASRTINTTAVVVSHPRRSAQGTGTMLHITSNLIFYDLAQALVKVILDRPKPHSSLLLESLLSTGKILLRLAWSFLIYIQTWRF